MWLLLEERRCSPEAAGRKHMWDYTDKVKDHFIESPQTSGKSKSRTESETWVPLPAATP